MNFVIEPSPTRTVLCCRAAAAAWAAAWVVVSLGFATWSALAQTGNAGGPGRPAVEVDLSVLDRLGKPTPRPAPGIQPRIGSRDAPGPPPAVGPLPPPGREGLRRMQRAINAWAMGTSAYVAEPAAPPRPSAAPPTQAARRSAPPPAPVAPARRPAPKPPVKPLIVAPPPPTPPAKPEVGRPDPPQLKPAPEPVISQPDPPPPQPAAKLALGQAEPAGSARDVPSAAPPPAQIAARPPAALPPGTELRVGFDSLSSDLAEAVKPDLDAIAARMTSQSALRMQLRAFAAGTEESSSQARRLSLVRALAVRSYLMKKGVRSTRMDVRALGTKSEDGPADRVDVVLFER